MIVVVETLLTLPAASRTRKAAVRVAGPSMPAAEKTGAAPDASTSKVVPS